MIKFKVVHSKARPDTVILICYAGPDVVKEIRHLHDAILGRAVAKEIYGPKYEQCIRLRAPQSVAEYEHYRESLAKWKTHLKSVVAKQLFKDNPLYMC